MTLKTQEYQQFFQKNHEAQFGIASYVIKGVKIQSPLNKNQNKMVKKEAGTGSSEAQIQTDDLATLLEREEGDNHFQQEDEVQQDDSDDSDNEEEFNPKEQPPFFKIIHPIKEIVKRPVSAVYNFQKQSQLQPTNITSSNPQPTTSIHPMRIEELSSSSNLNKNSQVSQDKKYNKTALLKSIRMEEKFERSVFSDKKQKTVELEDYLNLILYDYQQEKFEENQKNINQTIQKFNLTQQLQQEDTMPIVAGSSIATNTKRKSTFSRQSSIDQRMQSEDGNSSAVQSTGLRLRRMTAKYGPRVDLVSHGFQHFKVQDIEQFFDPLRLKLMTVPLSDIPNQYTKSGSDYHFVTGFKLQQMQDHQSALNAYEEGIQKFPDSSYNCKFNKGVILFKLGLFKESLRTYRLISQDDPLDKRLAYNKAICELQNGLYSQCIATIDNYVQDFNERIERLEKDRIGEITLSYQEKIRIQKPTHLIDNQYLQDFYQIRGVACLRANIVTEAARSFEKAQEYKNMIAKGEINTQSMGKRRTNAQDFTEVTLQYFHSKKTSSKDHQQESKHYLPSENQGKAYKIRPLTAKLPKSQSQQILKLPLNQQKLETLEEENAQNNFQNQYSDLKRNDFSSTLQGDSLQKGDSDPMFSLDPDSIMRTLDRYDQEHKAIKNDVMRLQQIKTKIQKPSKDQSIYRNQLNANRNLTNLIVSKSNQNIHKQQSYFSQTKNLLLNIEKPKGTIAQFMAFNQDMKDQKVENKEFKTKLVNYELKKIQQKGQLKKDGNQNKLRDQNIDSFGYNNDYYEPDIEEEYIMRHQNHYYIDEEKQIRLDKILLGFEIDPLNDSITDKELQVREIRHTIEKDLASSQSQQYSRYQTLKDQSETDQQKKEQMFIDMLRIQERDASSLGNNSKLTSEGIKDLEQMQKEMLQFKKHIDDVYKDQSKTELNLDKNNALIEQMNQALEQSGQTFLDASKLLLPQEKKTLVLDKRLRQTELEEFLSILDQESSQDIKLDINQEVDKYLSKLKFFFKFPKEIRTQLYQFGVLRQFKKNQVIFDQGEESQDFYVVIRGSVGVKILKEELGLVEVFTKICYDGDYIGEMAFFQQEDLSNKQELRDLNQQRTSTIALEGPTFLLQLSKQKTHYLLNSPDLQLKYQERMDFLLHLDIFEGIDRYILLPLASNIQIKFFKMGEYLVKAGEVPPGLIIIKGGQCIVAAEKLAMRSSMKSEYNRIKSRLKNIQTAPTGNQIVQAGSSGANSQQKTGIKSQYYYSDSLGHVNTHKRTYQNEQILVDDKGQRMKDFTVYKDLMVFFKLMSKSYFGGRALLPVQQNKTTPDEKPSLMLQPDAKRRGAWFAGGLSSINKNQGVTNLGDFEHLFIKRRYSQTTQRIMKNDRSSMLSVIANSSEVEAYIIDQQLLDFLPEPTQKQIWNKIMHVFEPDRPYTLKNVQKIKDKFREWDVYKIKSVQEHMKTNFNQRRENKQKQLVELDR